MIRIDAFLLAIAIAAALGVVTSQHKARQLYADLAREQQRAHELDVEWGQLQLEQSTWAAHARVNAIVREQMGMTSPGRGVIIVVENDDD